MTAAEQEGGRRSRRGFAYQDAVTLLDCLDMHAGSYESVGFEDLDDIVCMRNGHAIYRQVKTKEDATRHSIATVCRPEIKNRIETSILGRLFSGKSLTSDSRFCLVLNETPLADLGAFRVERGKTRGPVDAVHYKSLEGKLENLRLPPGFKIAWFIDRFDVMIEARTIEQVENSILRLLEPPVSSILGQPPLTRELDDVLVRLSSFLSRDAMAHEVRRWDLAHFEATLESAVQAATGRRTDGSTEPLQKLVDKLRPAEIPLAEATAQTEALLRYRRRYRSAVGNERGVFDAINDHVFAICSEISARRRSGEIPPGKDAYAATVSAVSGRPLVPAVAVSLSDMLSALSDVTARCENRYTDGT